MSALQLLRGLFLLFIFSSPLHGLVLSPCAVKDGPAPIAINLGIDAITAVCAESNIVTSTIATVVVWDDDQQLMDYRKAMLQMRYQYLQREAPHMIKRPTFSQKAMTSVSKTMSGLANLLAGVSLGLVSLSGSELLDNMCRHIYSWTLSASHRLAPVLARLNFSSQSEIEPLSLEELKAVFTQAFQVLKNVSMEETGINITSSVVLYPDWLEYATHRPIYEAAHEADIYVYMQQTPHEMITQYGHILDESSAGVNHLKKTKCNQISVIIDYGFTHFEVQTRGKAHKDKWVIDIMGGHYNVGIALKKVISSGQGLPEEHEIDDSSKEKLFLAVAKARREMKEQMGHETWEEPEGTSEIKEWPIKLKDWSNGEDIDVVLSWNDVKEVEAAYMDWLKDFFSLLVENLYVVQEDENGDLFTLSEPVDKVFILGNWPDRSLVSRAVRQSFGAETKVIGGNDEVDITLEAQGGARLAWLIYEEIIRNRIRDGYKEPIVDGRWVHEDL